MPETIKAYLETQRALRAIEKRGYSKSGDDTEAAVLRAAARGYEADLLAEYGR